MHDFLFRPVPLCLAFFAFLGLMACLGPGPSNTSFTHPYSGPEGTNSASSSPQPSGSPALAGGNGSATVIGTLQGQTFAPTTALFDTATSGQNLLVYLSDDANACASLTATNHNNLASSSYAVIQLRAYDATPAAVAINANTYSIVDSSVIDTPTTGYWAAFDFFALNGNCSKVVSVKGQSGTLMLDAFTAADPNATGSIASLVVGTDGSQVSATFTALPCAGLYSAVISPPSSAGCQ